MMIHLISFLQDFDKIIRQAFVLVCEEGVRCAFVVRSSGSSYSVHVVFNVVGEIVVDDIFDIVDI